MIHTKKTPRARAPLKITAVKLVLPYLQRYFSQYGYMPSNKDVALAFGRNSSEWGRLVIAELQKLKLIKVGKNKVRAIKIINK